MPMTGEHDGSVLKVMVVGQTPPPHHGSNVMTAVFLEALGAIGVNAVHVDKRFSLNMEEVQRFKPVKLLRIAAVTRDLVNRIRRERPDMLVYFVSTLASGLAVDSALLGAARAHGVPCVLYVHGVGHARNYRRPHVRVLYETVLKRCRALLILSRMHREDVAFFERPTYVLPNCLPPEDEALIHAVRGDREAGRNKTARIVFLSNLFPAKGVRELIDALGRLKQRGLEFEAEVIGRFLTPEFEAEIRSHADELGLNETQLRFLGPLYGEEKAARMAAGDIFAFASHRENFPLACLEAMAHGMAIVGTDVGALPDMVTGGESGLIVKRKDAKALEDALAQLIGDPERRERMGRAALKRYENEYGFDAYCKRLNDILTTLRTTAI